MPSERAIRTALNAGATLLETFASDVLSGWRYVLVAYEFFGERAKFVSNGATREEVAEVLRREGEKAAAGMPTTFFCDDPGHEEALTGDQAMRLAMGLRPLADAVLDAMPKGWGFALIFYAQRSAQTVCLATGKGEVFGRNLIALADGIAADTEAPWQPKLH